MPLFTKNFTQYGAQYGCGAGSIANNINASIDCYDNATRVGSIVFFGDGSGLPKNSVNSDGTLTLYHFISRYNDVITTLRFEGPLFIAVNSDTGWGYIGQSTLEPVGEQEPASFTGQPVLV